MGNSRTEYVERTHYVERRPLSAADLTADQAYHVAMRRRHNLGIHGWGTVTGLELSVAGGEIWLAPGLAVDGYGRELIVPEAAPLSRQQDLFACCSPVAEGETARVSLWLCYERLAETAPVPGHSTSGPGQHTRWREAVCLLVKGLASGEEPGPLTPGEVVFDGIDCDASQAWPLSLGCAFAVSATPPDDPARRWPVYLGTASRMMPDGDIALNLDGRPRVWLVGELVASPPARATPERSQAADPQAAPPHFAAARMQVGGEYDDDLYRFVISTTDEQGRYAERLAVDRAGNFYSFGPTAVGAALVDLDVLRGVLFGADKAWPYLPAELRDPAVLVDRIRRDEDPVSDLLRAWLQRETFEGLTALKPGDAPQDGLLRRLVVDLNRLLLSGAQYDRLVGELFGASAAWPFAEPQLKQRDELVERLKAVAAAWKSFDEQGKAESRRKDPCGWFIYGGLDQAAREALDEATRAEPAGEAPDPSYPQDLFKLLVAQINRLLAGSDADRHRRVELVSLSGTIFDAGAAWPYLPAELRDPATLVDRIRRDEDPVGDLLRAWLQQDTFKDLTALKPGDAPQDDLLRRLVVDLNRLLLAGAEYDLLVGELFDASAAWPFAEPQLKQRDELVERLKKVAEDQDSSDEPRKAESRREDPCGWFIYGGLDPAARKALPKATAAEPADEAPDPYPQDLFKLLVAQINRLLARPQDFEPVALLMLGGPSESLAPEDKLPPAGQVGYGAGIAFVEPLAPPLAARPWQIYRSDWEEGGAPHGQLRVELYNPGEQGDPPRQQLVIGASTPVAFEPYLLVGGDSTVTVYGDLTVEGQLVESPVDANPDDPRFLAQQVARRQLASMDTTSLKVSIKQESIHITAALVTKLRATITLTNSSKARITELEIYETLVIAGYPETLTRQILGPGIPDGLEAEEVSLPIVREYELPAGASQGCYVLITAIGIAAGIRLVYQAEVLEYKPPQTGGAAEP